MITKEKVLEALGYVDDPDLKKDIVTLGMVKDVAVEGNNVSFTVELTTPACPLKEVIKNACINAVKHYVSQDAIININMTARVAAGKTNTKGGLPGVKNIIAVASGKGGVGKSTVSSNLALALSMQGAKVGIVDADIYGPSIPMMFDVMTAKPAGKKVGDQSFMVPVESYGVKILSIGFFADPSQAIVWRGAMAVKALTQMLKESYWDDLDYLIVDLPPGTGDIHLSLVGAVPLTGAIVVSTPQQVAVADAQKAIAMFNMPAINVPVIGIVENMSYFVPDDRPDDKYFIFGKNGVDALANRYNIPVLGRIPIVQSICESGDAGRPAVLQETTAQAKAFLEMAGNVVRQMAIMNANHIEKPITA